MKAQIPFLVAIHRACNLTWLRFQALNNFFEGDFERAFNAKISDWQAAGVDKIGLEKFFAATVDPEQEMTKIKACGAEVLVYGTPEFPVSLLDIPSPPVLLFVRGEVKLSDFPALAIVGSRKVTDYGKSALDTLITPSVQQGVTTVSGLAFGVDKLAHELSLQHGQRTLAVLGNGLDQIYPKSHANLAQKIIENGALISEYLPGVEPRPEHFPQRNRIVSGLSKAVVLVEAAAKSGTLITAAWANEQGRDIFAIPGNIFIPQSKGTNQLIAQGLATALVDTEQIQSLYALKSKPANLDISGLSEIDQAIIQCLAETSPQHSDEIIRQLDFPAPVISSQIMLLEVRGLIKDTGQQMLVKNF